MDSQVPFKGLRDTLLEWSRYYLGYPQPPSRVIEFRGRKHLIELLKQGKPVLVALSIHGCVVYLPWTSRFYVG